MNTAETVKVNGHNLYGKKLTLNPVKVEINASRSNITPELVKTTVEIRL
jgi:hypothetical protein